MSKSLREAIEICAAWARRHEPEKYKADIAATHAANVVDMPPEVANLLPDEPEPDEIKVGDWVEVIENNLVANEVYFRTAQQVFSVEDHGVWLSNGFGYTSNEVRKLTPNDGVRLSDGKVMRDWFKRYPDSPDRGTRIIRSTVLTPEMLEGTHGTNRKTSN